MPETATDPIDGFEPIAIVYSLSEATVLLATLRAYGFFGLPRNQGHISVVPGLMLALGGIWITVPREQAEDAIALMEEIDQGWSRPSLTISGAPTLNRIAWVAMIVCFAPPMPRVPGIYRWRSALAAASPDGA
jgi:hypothetical protein